MPASPKAPTTAPPAAPTAAPRTLPARLHRAAVGRADLLRLMVHLGDGGDTLLAQLTGFGVKVRLDADAGPPQPLPATPPAAAPATTAQALGLPVLRARQFAMVDAVRPASDLPARPNPLDEPGPLDESPIRADHSRPLPPPQPLSTPRRIATLVRQVFRRAMPSRQLDVARWMAQVAQGQPPQRLPLRALPSWASGGALCIAESADLVPLLDDVERLIAATRRAAADRVPVLWRDQAGQWWSRRPGPEGQPKGWRPVTPAWVAGFSRLLLVGTSLPAPHAAAPAWSHPQALPAARPGQRLVLMSPGLPVGPGWPASTRQVRWDHGARLRLQRLHARAQAEPAPDCSDLLACLAMAVRVGPPLLRAVCQLLRLPALAETTVWAHPDVDSCLLGLQVRPDRLAQHREHARSHITHQQRRAVARLVRAHNARLSPLIQDEEAALAADLAGHAAGAPPDTWMLRARTLAQRPGSAGAQDSARYVRRLASRAAGLHWSAMPGLAEAWLLAEQTQVRAGAPLPPGMPPQAVANVMGRGPGPAAPGVVWQLVQQGDRLRLQVAQPTLHQSAVATLGPLAWGQGVLVGHASAQQWLPLHATGVNLLRLDGPGPWTLRAGAQAITVSEVARPRGVHDWGRDRLGLYATTPPLGRLQTRFDAAADTPLDPEHPLVPLLQAERLASPVHRFNTASWRFGVDLRAGVFAELALGPLTQRFRWIPAGVFSMGSPADEPERSDREGPCHRVRLTEGFWLADTACTQALWMAVMGGRNPSHFSGDAQRPVERVSWDDVQIFLQALQPRLPPGSQAVLPTEAEWEYACRAGTTTPFNGPVPITPAVVNFDASVPSPLAALGEASLTTVPVKSLPPNAWGLYEMHGNVWEWCADAMRDYAETANWTGLLENPSGPQEQGPEAFRAVRGGSWASDAGVARSAYRGAAQHQDRDRFLGFRFALRSTSPEAPEGPSDLAAPEGRSIPGQPGRGPEAQGPTASPGAAPARSVGQRLREALRLKAKPQSTPPKRPK